MDKYQEALEIIKKVDVSNQGYSQLIEDDYCEEVSTLQELIDNYNDCRNELCLKCGNYKESHLGKCDGCRWYK